MDEHQIGTGNYTGGLAGYWAVGIDEVSYPCRQTVIIPQVTGDIYDRPDTDISKFLVRANSHAKLRAANSRAACLIQNEIVVVIKAVLDGTAERLGQVRIAVELPGRQVEGVAVKAFRPVGLCCVTC